MKRATYLSRTAVLAVYISIHALVKRATPDILKVSKGHIISIHALVKRATLSQGNNITV